MRQQSHDHRTRMRGWVSEGCGDRWVSKVLATQVWRPELDYPQKPELMACACNSSAREAETGGSLGLLASQPVLIGVFQVPAKGFISKNIVDASWGTTPTFDLWPSFHITSSPTWNMSGHLCVMLQIYCRIHRLLSFVYDWNTLFLYVHSSSKINNLKHTIEVYSYSQIYI